MSREIPFTKMHGLGNDFVVFDLTVQNLNLDRETVRHVADRHFGIGCDQVLLVERSRLDGIAFRYRIFNADGEEVEQCGNGARCFARFVRDRGLIDQDRFDVETLGGVITLEIRDDGQVTVNMGAPELEPARIPFDAPVRADSYPLTLDDRHFQIGAVSMGNPHLVLNVDDVEAAPVSELGPSLESHPRFPNRVNVGFMQVIDSGHIRLRVFERGVGETLACGTGACAAVVVGRQQGLLSDPVIVDLAGGSLSIAWKGGDNPLYMTGPVSYVFEGRITL